MSCRARHAKPRRSRHLTRALLATGLGTGLAATSAVAADAYTVRPGDTLSEIAEAHGKDWRLLAATNHLADPDFILAGQHLDLGDTRYVPAQPRVYKQQRATKSRVKATRSTNRTRLMSAAQGTGLLTGAWRKVANCESSLNPGALNPGGKYRGLFQFDMATWRSVGGSGDPARASAAEQLKRAKALYASRGAQPWPQCGRYLR